MKFSEFLKEEGGSSLIGKKINDKLITKDTKNEHWDGDFDCGGNQLTSLAGAPTSVDGGFYCYGNQLTSLDGAPSSVGGDFSCFGNQLTSLAGAPSSVGGYFACYGNQLTSLDGAPSSVGGDFSCFGNQLTSLAGAPSSVGGYFACSDNQLTSLAGIHKIIKKMDGIFYATGNPIKSHVLGLLMIPGCKEVELKNKKVEKILNKYLPNTGGNQWVMQCQTELIEAGYRDYAKL